MSTPDPTAEKGLRELDKLLTHYIGPMAKIVLARAARAARDDAQLLQALAEQVDAKADQAAFVKAAGLALAAHPVIRHSAVTAAAQLQSPSPAPSPAPAPPPSAAGPGRVPLPRPAAPAVETGGMKAGSIFISYAREDLSVAQRIAHALHAAGLDIWLDFGRLQAGDAWDIKIRRNIEMCSFFVPLISQTTETRQEGYFRREWNIAADRALNFADDVPFILPVTIDDTQAYSARVPERFKRAHWITLPDGEVTGELVECLRQLMADYRASR